MLRIAGCCFYLSGMLAFGAPAADAMTKEEFDALKKDVEFLRRQLRADEEKHGKGLGNGSRKYGPVRPFCVNLGGKLCFYPLIECWHQHVESKPRDLLDTIDENYARLSLAALPISKKIETKSPENTSAFAPLFYFTLKLRLDFRCKIPRQDVILGQFKPRLGEASEWRTSEQLGKLEDSMCAGFQKAKFDTWQKQHPCSGWWDDPLWYHPFDTRF